jgi:hypothetical protein
MPERYLRVDAFLMAHARAHASYNSNVNSIGSDREGSQPVASNNNNNNNICKGVESVTVITGVTSLSSGLLKSVPSPFTSIFMNVFSFDFFS